MSLLPYAYRPEWWLCALNATKHKAEQAAITSEAVLNAGAVENLHPGRDAAIDFGKDD
jgi:hypothetical protein